jgi:hypothetical protein
VTPAADPVLVGFSQQIVDGVDPFRIDLAQWSFGEIVAGIEEGEGFAAGVFSGGRPAEMFFVIAVQRRTATGVAGSRRKYSMLTATNSLGLLVS